jgi:hypothetical protein
VTEFTSRARDPRVGRRRLTRFVLGGTILAFELGRPAAAHADTAKSARLQAILDALSRQGRQDQSRLIDQALIASSQLLGQFNAAANSGRLTAIEVTAQRPGPFAGTITQGRLLFAPDFVPQLRKQRLHDVVHADDILPDNLVFALGTLIFYADAPPIPFGGNVQAFVKAATERDAKAFINGWNAVVDAAVKENRGKTLSPQQIALMTLNLRYRSVFVNQTARNRYKFSPGGTIQPSQENVEALADGLGKMNILDIGVPPGP